MRTVVIGAGGVGGVLGGLLARASHEVTFLARGEQLAAIRLRGLEVRSAQFGTFVARVRATDDPAELGRAEFVLVAVKMYDLDVAAEAARAALAPGGVVLPIQNGLDAPGHLAERLGREPILVGTAIIDAMVAQAGVVVQSVPFHQLTVSELAGPPSPRVAALVETLRSAQINAVPAPDGQQALWNKVALQVPLASLTAAGNCGYGRILALPEARALQDELFSEVIAVASAAGYDVRLAVTAGRATAEKLGTAMATATTSLARDFQQGKPTELEWQTGAIVRLGAKHGVPTPVHRILYGVLKLRERTRAWGEGDR